MPRDEAGTRATLPLTAPEADHLWQGNRAIAALDPASFGIDERSLGDTIRFATELAGIITYTRPDGALVRPGTGPDWRAFFRDDPSFLLARILGHTPGGDARADWDALRGWYHEARWLARRAPHAALAEGLCTLIDAAGEADLLPGQAVGTGAGSGAGAGTGAVDGAGAVDRTGAVDGAGAGAGAGRAALGTAQSRSAAPGPGPAWHLRDLSQVATSRLAPLIIRLQTTARQAFEDALGGSPHHPAHAGLFLAFAQVLQTTRAGLNGLTARHLEFYYRQVLQEAPAPARPDTAFLALSFGKGSPPVTLEAGHVFVGPQAADGRPSAFTLDRTASFSPARLLAIDRLSLWQDRHGGIGGLSAEALPLSAVPGGWPAFLTTRGEAAAASPVKPAAASAPSTAPSTAPASAPPALCGLMVSSPALALSGGTRQIDLTLRLADPAGRGLGQALRQLSARLAGQGVAATGAEALHAALAAAYLVEVSTARGPLPPATVSVLRADPDDPAGPALAFRLTLPAAAPPLAADPASGLTAPWLRLTLNPAARPFGYAPLGRFLVTDAQLAITVTDLPGAVTGPGQGKPVPVDGALPFGPVPAPGARLELSHPDLIGEGADSLSLAWSWTGLPAAPSDLASHYAGYGAAIANDSFRATTGLGDGSEWAAALPEGRPEAERVQGVPLFALSPDGRPDGQMTRRLALSFTAAPGAGQGAGAAAPIRRVRLTWAAPAIGLGQKLYPALLAEAVLDKATRWKIPATLLKWLGLEKPAALPAPPLVVKLADLALGYTRRAALSAGTAQLWRLAPLDAPRAVSQCPLSPLPMAGRALLRFTLSGLAPGAALNLLCLTADGPRARATPGLPEASEPPLPVQWAYLSASGWAALPDGNVLADATDSLRQSGVVSLALPPDAALGPAGEVQLGLTAPPGVVPPGRIVQLLTGGATVTRQLTAESGAAVAAPAVAAPAAAAPAAAAPGAASPVPMQPSLPAGAIKGSALPVPGLTAVAQPLPSAGGQAAETVQAFRQRLSDRLRTKGRAICPRDYETLVLDAFPDIAEAKCLPDVEEGGLTLVVTPLAGRDLPGAQPGVSLPRRREIAAHLASRAALWDGAIRVVSPRYEPVQLRAWLALAPGASRSDVLAAVAARFSALLCPWRGPALLPMQIGTGRVEAAAVAAELEGLPGLARLTGVSLVQTYVAPGSGSGATAAAAASALHGLKDTARATPARGWQPAGVIRSAGPRSVLVPAAHHDLRLLPPDRAIGQLSVAGDLFAASPEELLLWRADPLAMPRAPARFGIGAMEIGASFIPTRPADATPPRAQGRPRPPETPPAPFAVLPPPAAAPGPGATAASSTPAPATLFAGRPAP